MKKSSLITFMCLLISISSARAQEVSYGVKAGVNFASLNLLNHQDHSFSDLSHIADYRTGFYAGAFVNIGLAENFSVQPELLYSMQGSEGDYEIQENLVRGEPKLNYLNLPVMAQYQVAGGLYAEAGPQIGFLLHAELDRRSIGEGGGGEVEGDAEFKDVDLGLAFGLGYKFSFGMGVNARFNLGLSDIDDTADSSGSSDDFGAKNRFFSAGLSYSF